jgi:hypothetical protein
MTRANTHPCVVNSQDIALALGKSYVERVAMEHFIQQIHDAPSNVRPVLKTLASLFALHKIEGTVCLCYFIVIFLAD